MDRERRVSQHGQTSNHVHPNPPPLISTRSANRSGSQDASMATSVNSASTGSNSSTMTSPYAKQYHSYRSSDRRGHNVNANNNGNNISGSNSEVTGTLTVHTSSNLSSKTGISGQFKPHQVVVLSSGANGQAVRVTERRLSATGQVNVSANSNVSPVRVMAVSPRRRSSSENERGEKRIILTTAKTSTSGSIGSASSASPEKNRSEEEGVLTTVGKSVENGVGNDVDSEETAVINDDKAKASTSSTPSSSNSASPVRITRLTRVISTPSEQHNTQTKILNAFRAQNYNPNSPSKGNQQQIIGANQMRFTVTTSSSGSNLQQDESSSSQSAFTSRYASPSKRKRRAYKGGTYNLYLSKKRKKKPSSTTPPLTDITLPLTDDNKGDGDHSNDISGVGNQSAQEEESSQSCVLDSEGDAESDNEYQDGELSGTGNESGNEMEENNEINDGEEEQGFSVEDQVQEDYVLEEQVGEDVSFEQEEEVEEEEVIGDGEELVMQDEIEDEGENKEMESETITQNEPSVTIKKTLITHEIAKDKGLNVSNGTSDASKQLEAKKQDDVSVTIITTQGNSTIGTASVSSSIIESVKNRPRSKRKLSGTDEFYVSPPPSVHSRSRQTSADNSNSSSNNQSINQNVNANTNVSTNASVIASTSNADRDVNRDQQVVTQKAIDSAATKFYRLERVPANQINQVPIQTPVQQKQPPISPPIHFKIANVTITQTNPVTPKPGTDYANRKFPIRTISTAGSADVSVTSVGSNQAVPSYENRKFITVIDHKMPPPEQITCLCTAKPQDSKNVQTLNYANSTNTEKEKSKYCMAVDSFDGERIGCTNLAPKTSMVHRVSRKTPFQVYCEVHLARLRRHQCCPGCGLFCLQGEFVECFALKKQVHLYHKTCSNERFNVNDPNQSQCLHCANISQTHTVSLRMNDGVNNTFYLQQHTKHVKNPRAKMTMTKKKGNKSDEDLKILEPFEEPGIEYIIPETKKDLSLAGLPLGPERNQLEELLSALSHDKQSPTIRFTNKNFYAVAKSGEVEKVLSLLIQGFDPNYTFEENDNETPLHAGASNGHLVVVHLLIQAGANTNVLNKNMVTPLMQAIENKHNSVVKYLTSVGASLDMRGEDGMTTLHIAAKSGNIEAIHHILQTGKINVNLQDDGGWTALVWATEHKHYNIVKLLLNKGADPNIEDDEDNISLHWAAFSGDVNIAILFLDMGCDLNRANIHGDSALHIAARRDNHDCVDLLLSRNADITLLNKNNETAFQCCPPKSKSSLFLEINKELKKITANRVSCSEKILHLDLSKGKEYYQMQVVNGVDDEPFPTDFMYITDNCETSQLNIDRTITSLQSCTCDDDCTNPDNCVCSQISFRCWYDKDRKLLPEFNLNDAPMIFECNRACNCWKTCNNRLVQFGIKSRLQVFRTKNKGWGVRTLRDIPRGTFVCEYVGEIITDIEADKREDDSYLFDLDNKDGETYCIDARFYGNITRFINHLCQPNLVPVKVFIDHQDLSFPRIALFSSKDIKAGEELGFDYGIKFWAIKHKWFTCTCSLPCCKYSKDSIQSTLETYYQRLKDVETRLGGEGSVAKIVD